MEHASVHDFLEETARVAGAVLRDYFGTSLTRNIKSHKDDFSTEADHASERIVIEAIRAQFPDDAILAEESGTFSGTTPYTWIIDPLDGTYNFAHGKDAFGVMIARAYQDEIIDAALYNPLREQFAIGSKGEGAFFNGERAEPVMPQLPGETQWLFGTTPHDTAQTEQAELIRVLAEEYGYTDHFSLRSACQNGLELLQGDVTGYILNYAYPWDLGPLDLLAAEAGYTVMQLTGEPYKWNEEHYGFLIAAPSVAETLIQYIV